MQKIIASIVFAALIFSSLSYSSDETTKNSNNKSIINLLIAAGAQSFNKARTLLMEAVISEDLDKIKQELLKADTNINAHDVTGRTALYYAVLINNNEMVKLLLEQRTIDACLTDSNGMTSLAIAADNGNYEIAYTILNNEKIDKAKLLSIRDNKAGYTPLMRAAQAGHQNLINLLVMHKANPVTAIRNQAGECCDSLILAQKRKKLNPDLDLTALQVEHQKYDKPTLEFMQAIGNFAKAKKLLETGNVNLNARFSDGRSIIQKVVNLNETFDDSAHLIKLLINSGACLDVISHDNLNLLHQLAYWQKSELVELILKTGLFDVNARDGLYKASPIILCLIREDYVQTKLVESLLKAGADPDARYDRGTALSLAVNKHFNAIEPLIRYGAAYSPDKILALACEKYSYRAASALITLVLENGGYDINKINKYGDTVLHRACRDRYGEIDIIRNLIAYGAHVNLANDEGLTPLQISVSADNKDATELLIKAGSKS